jgi:hypothetical protein
MFVVHQPATLQVHATHEVPMTEKIFMRAVCLFVLGRRALASSKRAGAKPALLDRKAETDQ